MNQIAENKNQIKRKFQWRDSQGGFHLPSEMETRHLFYTLRMIWNHTMPDQAQIKPFRRYEFGEHYTEYYLKDAVLNLAHELKTRNDMTAEWRAQLSFMVGWLSTHQPEKNQ